MCLIYLLAEKHFQALNQSFKAEQIVPIGGDVNFVDDFIRGTGRAVGALLLRDNLPFARLIDKTIIMKHSVHTFLIQTYHFIKFDPEFEAQFIKFLFSCKIIFTYVENDSK